MNKHKEFITKSVRTLLAHKNKKASNFWLGVSQELTVPDGFSFGRGDWI